MPDVRQQIREDRGLLKKIQGVIPGFAGYRAREDLRAADNIIRIQMAERLGKVRSRLEESRAELAEKYEKENITKVGGLINKFKEIEGTVRHADQGYTGISPMLRIEDAEINHLYEFDLSMCNGIAGMDASVGRIKAAVLSEKATDVKFELLELDRLLKEFKEVFDRRLEVITGTVAVQ